MPSRVPARASSRSISTSCSRMSQAAVGRVAAHFKLPLDSRWLDDIARSPVLTRYSKSPDFEYSPQVRRELLRQSRQNNAAQIAAGLRWLESLAGSQPAVAEVLEEVRMTDVAALTTLGRRLLVGDGMPSSPEKAIATLREAAARGGGEAAALLSICAAWGVAQARNVDAALDHLARAAELGWAPALRELQLLARDPGAIRQRCDARSTWRRGDPRRRPASCSRSRASSLSSALQPPTNVSG